MPYTLQMLRALMETHPDRAEPLRIHIEALERSIETQPAFCLQSVRTLFEAAHATIAPRLGIAFPKNGGFPDRMRGVIAAMDFSIADHPNAIDINDQIKALTTGIDDVAIQRIKAGDMLQHEALLGGRRGEAAHGILLLVQSICFTLT